MRCVKCDEPLSALDQPCPHCQFAGDPARIEELSHVNWLLDQIDALKKLGIPDKRLADFYRARQRELEIQLGLRAPALTPDQVWEIRATLAQGDALLRKIDAWLAADLLDRVALAPILAETRARVRALEKQLEGYTPAAYPRTNADRLAIVEFLLAVIEKLTERGGLVSVAAQDRARAPLLAEKEQLEIKLGLRKLQPAPAPPEQLAASLPPVAQVVPPVPPPPRAPQPPLRDRFLGSLLSERTLQAMLF
ncbi:MAG: hypothetical protein L0Y55_13570, partial [Anaerolineales bacterium]|nr:hypothetical protein [Anaerolineales bacterium]